MGVLLLIAAIVLIILNPFHGAVVIGAVAAGVLAFFTAVSLLVVGAATKNIRNWDRP